MDNAQKITHVLDRLSLGPRPGDRTQVERMGIERYIQTQLNPQPENLPNPLKRTLGAFSTLKLSPIELHTQYGPPPRNASMQQREAAQMRQRQVVQETLQIRIHKALENPNQLQEVMTDFWFNHFNVFLDKGITRIWVGVYEKDVIRPYALGKFRNLLGATAKHPAMAFYLDNWRNTDPNSNRARGQFKGLNENYARELLELHTMGVEGGYTQADVESLTRILTGWGLVRTQGQGNHDGSGFQFQPRRHDSSDKTFLGQSIPGGGIDEGETALDMLAQHPSTAQHISYKLAQHFVSDTPPEGLVNRLAERFLASDGCIQSVLQTLFADDAFWQDDYYQTKFKTPYQFMLSMARGAGISSPEENVVRRLLGSLNQLGMPLYRCRTPDGYAQVESAWLNPDALLRRISFARAVVNMKGEKPEITDLLATLGNQFSPETLSVVNSARPGIQSFLLLGSPEMMYR
ncbi:MAG: DUF1800 domain-containing protein [Cyanobacteria bacterium J06621_11]